jgi:hypothetical protein
MTLASLFLGILFLFLILKPTKRLDNKNIELEKNN